MTQAPPLSPDRDLAAARAVMPEREGPAMPRAAEVRLRTLFLSGQSGHADDYRAFLHALTVHVRAYLRRRLVQFQDDVEDLLQEVLLAVHNGRHTYRPDQPFTAWVHAIARHKLMDFWRARSRHEALNEPLDDHVDLFVCTDAEPAEARRDLGQLLERLPDRQRLPILHVKLQGLSVVETSALTGLSESAVKVGIHRGLKALAAIIRGAA